MRKLIILIFSLILAEFLASCALNHTHSISNKSSVDQCKAICVKRFERCTHHCVDNCKNCTIKAYSESQENYQQYVQEQQVLGQSIDRVLNSYRDPLQCRKITCDCVEDLNSCRQGCTGLIRKQLQAVTHCI